jgi:hypothetical protein
VHAAVTTTSTTTAAATATSLSVFVSVSSLGLDAACWIEQCGRHDIMHLHSVIIMVGNLGKIINAQMYVLYRNASTKDLLFYRLVCSCRANALALGVFARHSRAYIYRTFVNTQMLFEYCRTTQASVKAFFVLHLFVAFVHPLFWVQVDLYIQSSPSYFSTEKKETHV